MNPIEGAQPSLREDNRVTAAERGLWRQPAHDWLFAGLQDGGARWGSEGYASPAAGNLPRPPTDPPKMASHVQNPASVQARQLQIASGSTEPCYQPAGQTLHVNA